MVSSPVSVIQKCSELEVGGSGPTEVRKFPRVVVTKYHSLAGGGRSGFKQKKFILPQF